MIELRPRECPITRQMCDEAYCALTGILQNGRTAEEYDQRNRDYDKTGISPLLWEVAEMGDPCRMQRIRRLHSRGKILHKVGQATAIMDRINEERREANADPQNFGQGISLADYMTTRYAGGKRIDGK